MDIFSQVVRPGTAAFGFACMLVENKDSYFTEVYQRAYGEIAPSRHEIFSAGIVHVTGVRLTEDEANALQHNCAQYLLLLDKLRGQQTLATWTPPPEIPTDLLNSWLAALSLKG